jgi:hypothetical protein
MKWTNRTTLMAFAIALPLSQAAAQADHPHLHLTTRWKECSIQLDPSLTQQAWRQFTQEAGLVAYFRPVSDARPMGRGKFEVSMLQWDTGIDDHDAAWNDTFVHPDTAHWLFEGDGLKFPGLMVRAGVSQKTDVGVYFTKNPNANYGFYGAQVQRQLLGDPQGTWAASARLSGVRLYGPEDVDLTIGGFDLVASRRFSLTSRISVSPYAGVSSYFSASHEKSRLVSLNNETVGESQAMVGASLQLSVARLGIEYNAAQVRTISMKVGIGM